MSENIPSNSCFPSVESNKSIKSENCFTPLKKATDKVGGRIREIDNDGLNPVRDKTPNVSVLPLASISNWVKLSSANTSLTVDKMIKAVNDIGFKASLFAEKKER